MSAEPKAHVGHRARLRERFMRSPGSVPDYELLEMFLYTVYPRIDTKPLAKSLMKKFATLGHLLYADKDHLRSVKGVSEIGISNLVLVREIFERLMREDLKSQPIFKSAERVISYFRALMGNLNVERFVVLFLNKKGQLLEEEFLETGTLDRVAIYPREIVKKAVTIGATAAIMAHNHPSGVALPSDADKGITSAVFDALRAVDVALMDHLIVTKESYFSFSGEGLLKP